MIKNIFNHRFVFKHITKYFYIFLLTKVCNGESVHHKLMFGYLEEMFYFASNIPLIVYEMFMLQAYYVYKTSQLYFQVVYI